MKRLLLVLLIQLFVFNLAFSQDSLSVKVVDADTRESLIGATVLLNEKEGAITNATGLAKVRIPEAPELMVKVSFVGYETLTKKLKPSQLNELLIIGLEAGEELEELYIQANRSGRTIANTPTRVEALDAEELEEKAVMRSANIAMLLRESTGILMQTTSIAAANQSIRMQGLDGRYTQLLKDGFPIYGGFSSGLSIMQIPPLDLQQVEIVKGSNSTLYGGGAIAGLVNLVSIQPKEEALLKVMVDQTSALGSTANLFYAKRNERVGMSIYGSINRQEVFDSNGDNFSDIPEIQSYTFNPVLYYYPNEKTTLRLALNLTRENRLGGNLGVIEGGQPLGFGFTQENISSRYAMQLSYKKALSDQTTLELKHSSNYFQREILEADYDFDGFQFATFNEATITKNTDRSNWVAGAVLQLDWFRHVPQYTTLKKASMPAQISSSTIPEELSNSIAGIFIQNTTDINDAISVEMGLRYDQSFYLESIQYANNDRVDFGGFLLPRASLLYSISEKLSMRIGGGAGYKLPSIFNEEAESLAFRNIQRLYNNQNLVAERSMGVNFDINYNTTFAEDWTFSFNQLFFRTVINDAVVLEPIVSTFYRFVNATDPVRSQGFETNLKLTYKDFKLFGNYAFIDTELSTSEGDRAIPLTPKHNIGAVLVYEQHGKWRIGLESYYKGEQFRRDFSQTDDYWLFGFMALRKFDRFSVYANFENFTDTRQHRLENFSANDHFSPNLPDIWAPLDGRVINAGFIYEF